MHCPVAYRKCSEADRFLFTGPVLTAGIGRADISMGRLTIAGKLYAGNEVGFLNLYMV